MSGIFSREYCIYFFMPYFNVETTGETMTSNINHLIIDVTTTGTLIRYAHLPDKPQVYPVPCGHMALWNTAFKQNVFNKLCLCVRDTLFFYCPALKYL